ncbi:MAG: thioredoxin domain-containing protein [Patescibacteria group bacterium]
MFKKENFPVKLFIIASLLSFIILGMLFVLLNINFKYPRLVNNNLSEDKYYFKQNFNESDPLITKVPSLDNILSGPILSNLDPGLGPEEAKVAVIIFSDFKCDYCLKQEQALKTIISKYGEQIRLFWKDYPETDRNSESFQAAVAARCAFVQGKFWPYHDLLFASKQNYNKDFFIKLAKEIGLSLNNFTICLDDAETYQQIENNILEAQALNINGVPFIYVNDQEIMGEISLTELDKIIKAELEKLP